MSAPKVTHGLFAGRFQILRELGRGGMGAVDLAYQVDLERHVALKRILPGNVGIPAAEGWFKREYKALAAIHHRGIPAIHECGKDEAGAAYFVMEVIEGPSLANALKIRSFTASEALSTAIELARILAAAHSVGVIHRDVKPTNIILDAGGRVRLIDFGICVFLPRFSSRPGLRCVDDDEYRTGPMEVPGSLGYTDPALYNRHPPSVQSDIFSVSVILYEMLAGRRLYNEMTGAFRQIDTGEFPPELTPVVSELRRACQPLPKDRHASMDEFVRALEIARSEMSRAPSAPPPTPPPSAPAATDREGVRKRLGPSPVLLIILIALVGALVIQRQITGVPIAASTPAPTATDPDGAMRSDNVPDMTAADITLLGVADETEDTQKATKITPPGVPSPVASKASKKPPIPAGTAAAEPSPARPRQKLMRAMLRLEPRIRACIVRETGEPPKQPLDVLLRFDPSTGAVDQVRVRDMGAAHPVAGCIDAIVREAAPPTTGRPNETCTLFEGTRTAHR